MGTVIVGYGELFFEGGGRIELRPNTTFLIPPMMEHGENSEGNIDIIFIGFRGSLLENDNERAVRSVTYRKLTTLVEKLWLRSVGQAGGLIGPLLDSMARTIMAEFTRCLTTPELDREISQIEEITQLMRRRLTENIRVPELARHMRLSTDYFRRVFKQHMQLTPMEYLIELRMQQAMQLLEHSDLAVSKIAQNSGYQDPLYFSRLFRRKVGCSPLEFRRRIRP